MFRRTFLAAAFTVAAAPAFAEPLDYTPGLVEERLAAGETVFVGFNTDWCTTCAAQERVIAALKNENPAYEENITFINVEYGGSSGADLTRELNIPRRSTLVVLRGGEELGRIVAGTRREDIQALMDTALAAGS